MPLSRPDSTSCPSGISEHFLHRIAECVKRILRVHGVAVLMDVQFVQEHFRVKYDNMEPCVYIKPGDHPRIIQYCCYAECNPIDHTYGAR